MYQPKCLNPNPIMGSTYLSPSLHQSCKQYRNMNLLSIGYAFQPRLRSRLTQGRRTLPWKPWSIGGKDSHLPYVTHTGILTSKRSSSPHDLPSAPLERSPTTYTRYKSAASVICLAPVHFRRRITRLVSYYALFKGWLLLSQPPSCSCNSTSFPT